MNITGTAFTAYLEKFHSVLSALAEEHLPLDIVRSLLHLSIAPANIRGFVSSQYGVAWEYITAPTPSIDVVVGSRRVDDLLLNRPTRFARDFADRPPAFNLHNASNVQFEHVWIRNEPVPFRLGGNETHITITDSKFDALGWSKEIAVAEIFGNREASFWSADAAITRAQEEVLTALTEVRRAALLTVPMSEYINSQKQKSVLVLGDYSPAGIVRLESLTKCLAGLGYNPFLVRDVPDIFAADIRQKVVILGGIARFVIIDDSSPSGHLFEVSLAQQNGWTTALLHADGKRGSWMTAGFAASNGNFRDQDYDPADPCPAVKQACDWAESRIGSLEQEHKKTYPWRS